MDIETKIFLIGSFLFATLAYFFRYRHQKLWKRFSEKHGLTFHPGKFKWGNLEMAQDRITGIYRGRELSFIYYVLMAADNDIWRIKIELKSSIRPEGNFRLAQKGLFNRGGPTTGDRYFDKHTKIVKQTPSGYVSIVLSDAALRRRIAEFFANPLMDDRKISLTPTGRLRFQDRGIFQTEKRLLNALDLLSDLAEVVEMLESRPEDYDT